MAEIDGSGIRITADDSQARKTINQFGDNLTGMKKRVNKTFGDTRPFDRLANGIKQMDRTIGKSIGNLPGHLQPFHKALNTTRKEMKETGREGADSLEELQDAAQKARVDVSKIGSASKGGKEAAKVMQNFTEQTKEARMAVMGLNKEGVRISAEEANETLEKFQDQVDETRERVEGFKKAGDMGSYSAGLQILEKNLADVDKSMRATARGGAAYNNMLSEMGVHTQWEANRMAVSMEAYRDQFFRSIDMINAKKSQSQRMMDILPETSRIQRIDKAFLSVGNRMEKMAKQGMAANLAVEMLGRNASMKDLRDRVRLINMGIMRMQMLAMGVGIAFLAMNAALFAAAKGPAYSDVLEKRAAAWKEYTDEVKKRTEEIMNTWNIFENVELKTFDPQQLRENLQEQLNIMQNWQTNLQTIADRLAGTTVGDQFLYHLRTMGPEAAGEIAALTQMSGEKLDEYANMWRDKLQLSNEAAISELEMMRQKTKDKVAEINDTLTPLGISVHEFVQSFTKASGPFVEQWGLFASKVFDAATALNNLIIQLNKTSPALGQAAGWFMYLFTALTLILSPMAIGIGRAKGFKAAFTAAFTPIKPFVLGLLRVAGIASVVAGAIILVGGTFLGMWKNSEALRDSVANLWKQFKAGIQPIVSQLQPAFTLLKAAFKGLIMAITGDGGSIGDVFQKMGDAVAAVINWFTANLLPKLMTGFSLAADFVKGAIAAVVPVIHEMALLFQRNGGQIKSAVSGAFNFIGKVIKFVMDVVIYNIKFYLNAALDVFQGVMGMIQGVIKMFRSVLTGDWKGLWEGFKTMLSGAVQAIWGLLQFWFIGRIAKIMGVFVSGIGRLFGGFIKRIVNYFKSMGQGISLAAQTAFGFVRRLVSGFTSAVSRGFSAFINGVVGFFRNMGTRIMKTWDDLILYVRVIVTRWIVRIVTSIRQFVMNIRLFFHDLRMSTSQTIRDMVSYLRTTIEGWITRIVNKFRSFRDNVVSSIKSFRDRGKAIFEDFVALIQLHIDDIITKAKNLPKAIGDGIRDNVGKAAGAMLELAKDLVTKFKEALGINSPSKVFLEMGWNIIRGLVNGLKGGNLKDLGMKVLKEFGGGALDSLKSVKGFLKNGWNQIQGMFGGGAGGNIGDWIQQAMDITGVPQSWKGALSTIAQHESGGNPRAVNNWDINAKRGIPSMGLMQTIGPTFRAHNLPGMNDILNPIHNAVAAIRYILDRYGNIANVPGIASMARGGAYRGYALGGFIDRPEMAMIGEDGPEVVMPLVGNRMDPFAISVADKLSDIFSGVGSSPGAGGNINIEVPLYINRREIARAIAEDVDKELQNIKSRDDRAKGKTRLT